MMATYQIGGTFRVSNEYGANLPGPYQRKHKRKNIGKVIQKIIKQH
jgi:hypothetical protein